MINKPLDTITKADVDALVNEKTRELKTLDYKETLPGNGDADKKEFLADVSSFGNAAGGDIVYGVSDERDASGRSTGIPKEALGLSPANIDAEILRLQSIIRDGLDPRLPGVEMKVVPGFQAGPVLIVRISRSWIGPHMVKFAGTSRFYARTSAGKYPLDVREIRAAFLAGEGFAERISRYRAERMTAILTGNAPARLAAGTKLIVHLVPIDAFDRRSQIALGNSDELGRQVPQLYLNESDSCRTNLDGVLSMCSGERGALSFIQVYRSGIIEAVDTCMLDGVAEKKAIRGFLIEKTIIERAKRYLTILQDLGVSLPILLLIDLVGVRGFSMERPRALPPIKPDLFTIDRDVVSLPDVFLDNQSADLSRTVRPAFDALWQACGFERSQNYDAEGNWTVK